MRLLIAAASAFLLSGIYTAPNAFGGLAEGVGAYRDIALIVILGVMMLEALLGLAAGRAKGGLLRVFIAAVAAVVLLILTMPGNPPPWDFTAAETQVLRPTGLILLTLYALIESVIAFRSKPAAPAAPVEEPKPFKPAVKEEAPPFGEVLVLLSLLQEKGRYLDFLMEDITQYNDTQVAAAARVVHQGCAGVVREYFSLAATHDGQEGAQVAIDKSADPSHYRLVGKVAGAPPFQGKLIHKGWKTKKITLPRSAKHIDPAVDNVITPAEVELK